MRNLIMQNMVMITKIIAVTSLLCLMCDANNFTDIQMAKVKLHNTLTDKSHYKSVMRPDDDMLLKMDFSVSSLIDFDDRNGELHVTGLVTMIWNDSRLSWSRDDFDIDVISLDLMEIWRPNIVLFNTVNQFKIYDGDTDRSAALVHSTGEVYYRFGGAFSVSCDPDLTYFPYDVHQCYLMFLSLEDTFPAVNMNMSVLSLMDMNVNVNLPHDDEWNYSTSKPCIWSMPMPSSYIYSTTGAAIFPIRLERKPTFLFINLVLPSIIQGFLNACVFFIPVEAGERLSFSVTLNLSYTVFFTAMSQYIPELPSQKSFINLLFIYIFYQNWAIMFVAIYFTRKYFSYVGMPVPVDHKNRERLIGLMFLLLSCLEAFIFCFADLTFVFVKLEKLSVCSQI